MRKQQHLASIPDVLYREIPADCIPFDKGAALIDKRQIGAQVWKRAVLAQKGGRMDDACELFLHALWLDASLTTNLKRAVCPELFSALKSSETDSARVLSTLIDAYSGLVNLPLFAQFERTLENGKPYGIFQCFVGRMLAAEASRSMNADLNIHALDAVKKAAVYGGDIINSLTMRFELGWAFRFVGFIFNSK